MSYVGEFHEVEKDGKSSDLVYHHPKYHPIPQTQSSSAEAIYDDCFLCPRARVIKDDSPHPTRLLSSPPGYVLSSTRTDRDHTVLPLFWCNNKEFDVNGGCSICEDTNFGTDYYYCDYCDEIYHKECVQSPPKLKHPYHPQHSLQLYFSSFSFGNCLCCARETICLVYYCSSCEVIMHPICAMKEIPFIIDPPKTHDHPLILFPRQSSLTCNVCGWLRNNHPTYICARCNFVAHNDCMHTPRIIKISRHHHRIKYISSLQSGEWSCGVCRKDIHNDYGAYSCDNCSDYAVHLRCATGEDVWDGKDLEGVPEDDDITQDAEPFIIISEGVILYFLHDHHLKLEVEMLYDENNICQACSLPIYEGNIYSCMKCDFILHETCSKAPRRIRHALHPHPLTLKTESRYDNQIFDCNVCRRVCGGFVYECCLGECDFSIDIRCASIFEPFDYKGHEHPLFLALDSKAQPTCHLCKRVCYHQLNCIKCDFIICIRCTTLPYKARYKHDTHFLTILCGEEVHGKDWCQVCERNLNDQGDKWFHMSNVYYWCNDCFTTFHIECIIGENPYLKPGRFIKLDEKVVQILRKANISRPLCGSCKNPCQDKIFKTYSKIACSLRCIKLLLGLYPR